MLTLLRVVVTYLTSLFLISKVKVFTNGSEFELELEVKFNTQQSLQLLSLDQLTKGFSATHFSCLRRGYHFGQNKEEMAFARRLGILYQQYQRSQPSIHSAFSPNLHHASRLMSSSTSIFLGGMSKWVKEEHVRHVFQKFGTITKMNLVVHHETGTCKGYAFIEFATEEEAKAAVAGMHGNYFRGRRMRVELHSGELRNKQEDASSEAQVSSEGA